ncbi:MAG: RlmE family RNA methyltransferase [Gammaproteobacteria bacterium]
MTNTKSEKRAAWINRHLRDPFVKQAQQQGKRSRASFKLQQIHDKDRLFTSGQTVIDLGAAPGGWSQVARERIGKTGMIIALDLLEMDPIPGVTFVQGDFLSEAVQLQLNNLLLGGKADLILSDMAPNLSGIAVADQARMMTLAETALDLASEWLKPGGGFLVKIFQGAGVDAFHRALKQSFKKVVVRKPAASRSESKEYYLLATGYNV